MDIKISHTFSEKLDNQDSTSILESIEPSIPYIINNTKQFQKHSVLFNSDSYCCYTTSTEMGPKTATDIYKDLYPSSIALESFLSRFFHLQELFKNIHGNPFLEVDVAYEDSSVITIIYKEQVTFCNEILALPKEIITKKLCPILALFIKFNDLGLAIHSFSPTNLLQNTRG